MLLISLLLITGIYFLANLSLVVIWLKNPIDSSFLKENIFETLKISVIIPVRNEAENVLFLLLELGLELDRPLPDFSP